MLSPAEEEEHERAAEEAGFRISILQVGVVLAVVGGGDGLGCLGAGAMSARHN
jgi:hypothetical protein